MTISHKFLHRVTYNMPISENKGRIILFMLAGAAMGAVVGPMIKNKQGLRLNVNLGILAFVALMAVWNIFMYRKAGSQSAIDSTPSTLARFTEPVASTVSFIIGLGLLLAGGR